MRPVVAIIANVEYPADYLFPGYPRVVLNQDYSRSLAAAGALPILIAPGEDLAVAAEAVALADGVVLAGGQDVDPLRYGQEPREKCGAPSPARDRFEWAVVDAVVATGKPLFGICRGLQVMNAYFGGTLHQDLSEAGTDVGHFQQANPEHGAHRLTAVPGGFVAEAIGSTATTVNTFHHQVVDDLAPDFAAVAHAPDGIIEAIQRDGEQLMAAVQWHPEMMSRNDRDAQALFAWFVQRVGQPKYRA